MAGLGDLVIKLHADMAQFSSDMGRAAHVSEREWRKVRRHAEDAGRAIALASVLAGAAVLKLGKDAIDTADNLYKMSQKVGVSVESLSGLQYAAKLSDVSVEQLSTGLRQLAKNAQDTAANTGEARLAFQAMGMSVTSASGQLKSTEGLLLEVANRFAGMEDGAGKTALAMKLFGRAGADLIPLLNLGAAGLKANADEAQRFGLIISTEAAKKAEEFNDQLTRVRESLRGFGLGIALDALPGLRKLIDEMIEGTRIAGGFGAAMARFGLGINPFKSNNENLQTVTANIDRLKQQRADAIDKGLTGRLPNIDAQLAAEQQRREFLLYQQRQEALGNLPPGMRDETQRYGGTAKTAAPLLPDEAALSKAKSEQQKFMQQWFKSIDDGQSAAIEEGQELIRNEVSETAKVIETEQRRLQAMYEMIDQEQKDAIEEGAKMIQDVTWDHKRLEDQQNRNKEAARDLGLTFASAFEDAIVSGKKFSDVLKGLAQDIARIFIRKQLTEPLAGAASSLFGGLGGIFGGGIGGGVPGSAGGLASTEGLAAALVGGGFATPFATGTDFVPQDMLAYVHKGEAIIPASQNNGSRGDTINVDMRGSMITVDAIHRLERMIAGVQKSVPSMARAAVADSRRRGA